MIHPNDAQARKIVDGGTVEVFNDTGRFRALAKVTEDVMPGVLASPLGYWASTSISGSTVNAVNSARFADLGRAPTFSECRVEVRAG